MKPLFQNLSSSTFLLGHGLFYSAIDANTWAQKGHNRSIHAVWPCTPLAELCLCLLKRPNCWSQGWERPESAEFPQTNTARINKRYKSSTQTQNGDLCPARIDFTRRFCPSTVAWQEPQWPLTPALEWPQCHPTLGADQPQWVSLRLRVAVILCGWSLGQSSVREAPIELEQSATKEALILCFQASC